MKGFLEGIVFRPQGKPMAYPYTMSAKLSQFPWRFLWHRSWTSRYFAYAVVFLVWPAYWQIDKVLTGPENKALWREKRKHDAEHHRKHLEKLWEVRT